MNKLKIKLSSTALSHSACMLEFKRTVVDGYRQAPSAKIVYGQAIHKYIQKMFDTDGNLPIAIKAARTTFDSPKTSQSKYEHLEDSNHMLAVANMVWYDWISDDSNFNVLKLDGKPAVEQTFDIPFYEDGDIEISLCGTIDSIGKINNGVYAIRDWKTTSFWNEQEYFAGYDMSKQLRFYTLACKLEAERSPDSILGKIGNTTMGAFIDGIFLNKELNKCRVKRSEIFQYDSKDMAEFEQMLRDFCGNLCVSLQNDYFPRVGILHGLCDKKYGKCNFWNVCKAPKHVSDIILSRDFKQMEWNPLNYGGVE